MWSQEEEDKLIIWMLMLRVADTAVWKCFLCHLGNQFLSEVLSSSLSREDVTLWVQSSKPLFPETVMYQQRSANKGKEHMVAGSKYSYDSMKWVVLWNSCSITNFQCWRNQQKENCNLKRNDYTFQHILPVYCNFKDLFFQSNLQHIWER